MSLPYRTMKMNGENGTCAHKVGSTDFINDKRKEKKRKCSQGNRGKEKGKRGERTGKRQRDEKPTACLRERHREKSQIPTPIQQYNSYVVLILAIPYTLTMRSPIALAMQEPAHHKSYCSNVM